MIETPPLLSIKRPSRRPTKAQIDAFQNVPTSFVVDAMQGGGTMSPNIRPLGESRDINCVAAGPALTVDSGPADVLSILAALDTVQPGDIVINATDGHQGCASAGDRVAAFLKNSGAVGLVTDGPVRDYAGLVDVGLPIWCTGLNPNTPFAHGPGRIGQPVQIAGSHVETGDMVVADFDGVVVVPFARLDEVIERLAMVIELEQKLDAELRDGLKIPDNIKTLLASDQVKYIV